MSILVVLISLMITIDSSHAFASNFGAYYANGVWHYFYNSGATTNWKNATGWSMSNNLNPTDINTAWVSGHDGSDVSVIDDTYPDSWVGIAECMIFGIVGGTCAHWHIRYNLKYEGSPWLFDDTDRRNVACQEYGHSVGLKHDDSGRTTCMISYHTRITSFSSHDISHINSRY